MNRKELLEDVEYLIARLIQPTAVLPPASPKELAETVTRWVGRVCAETIEEDARGWEVQRDRLQADSTEWWRARCQATSLRKAGGNIRLLTGARDDLVTVDDD